MRRPAWAFLVAVAACRGPADDALHYGAGLPLAGLNPLLRDHDWTEASSLILSRLFVPDHHGQVVGDLAESSEVSRDGLTFTVTLRDRVYWHDGTALTAEDVAFTFARLFDSATATDLDLNLPTVRSVATRDPRTVDFALSVRTPGLPAALVEVPILPRHLLQGVDLNGDAFDRSPVGSGPFRLVARTSDSLWVFRRHDRYHLARPRISTILLRAVPSPSDRAALLAAGTLDLAEVKAPDAPRLVGSAGVALYTMRTGAWRAMPLNLRNPVLRDAAVRRAISLAIDRDQLVLEALGGLGLPAYLPVAPGTWAYPDTFTVSARNVEEARRLLRGRTFALRVICWREETFRRTACELLGKQLAEVGIVVRPSFVDQQTYVRLASNMGDDYDAFIGGWGSLLDPVDNLYKKFHSRGSQNDGGYSNPAVDRALEVLRTLPPGPEAKGRLRPLLELLAQEMPWVPLVYPGYLFGANRRLDGVSDFTVDSWYEFTRYAGEWGWR